jgi:hypothetical protein
MYPQEYYPQGYYPQQVVYIAPQQLSPMELMPQVVYSALSLSIFAEALGLIVVASGAAGGFGVPPAELKATDPAIEDLRRAFGDDIVSRALTDVPEGEAIALAQRVEYYVHRDLRSKYGDWAAERAIEGAPPGDLRTAQEIARTLSDRGVTSSSSAPEKARAVAVGKIKGRSLARPHRDTRTNIVYGSEYKAAAAVAAEYTDPKTGKKLDPTNTWVWYKIKQLDPNRFVPA